MASKTYNGTTTIDNIPFTGVGLLAGDAVSLGGTGNYTNKNAGANKTYTVDNMALLGADAANYLLAGGPSLLRNDGLITPKAVVVSGINASNKIYDGTTSADVNLTNLVFEGLISGDDLTAADTIGVFSDKNVGSNKTVNLVGTTYSGADAANYTISSQLSAAADITPKPLFLLGNTGVNKSFDGTADIVGGPAYGNLSGVINGEQVMLDGNAVYDSSIAGNRIVISGSLVLVGIDAANYSLAWSNGSGVISAKVSEQNAIASVTLPPNVPQPALPNPTNAPAIIAFEINENSFDGSSKSGSKAKSKVDGSDDNGNSDNSDEDCSPEKSTSGGDSSGASEPCGARLTPLISYNM